MQTTLGLMPTISSTTFLWRYGSIARPGEGDFFGVYPNLQGLDGYYVRIVEPPEDPMTDDVWPVLWTGRFSDDSFVPGGNDPAGTGTGDQIFTAFGMERILKQSAVDGSYFFKSPLVVKVDTRLSFNLRHRTGASMSGNRSAQKHDGCYVFSDEGELWTARDVAEYLLVKFGPASPAFSLTDGDETNNLDLYVDTWPAPKNVADGLNMLIRRQRGCAWRVVVYGEEPKVEPRSVFAADVTAGGVTIKPNSVQVNLDFDAKEQQLDKVTIRKSQDHRYDEIHVLGNHAWICGAVGLSAAWSSGEETAYKAADDKARRQDRYGHVYTAFRVQIAGFGPFIDAAGDPLGIPVITDDGQVEFSDDSPLFTLGRPLTRQTPLRVGYAYDTGYEVQRDASAPGGFLPPAVFIKFTASGSDAYCQVDALSETFEGAPPVRVGVLDGEMGLQLRPSYNHLFAKNHWGASVSARPPIFDWENLYATAALRADVRLRVVVKITDPLRVDNPRRLIIEVPDAECWIVRKGAIVGIDGSSLQRVPKDIELRNDRDRLLAVAAMAKAWYGRTRRAISVKYKQIAWRTTQDHTLLPGNLLQKVFIHGQTLSVGTIISRLTWDWANKTTTLQTDFDELDFIGLAGRSRSGSGGNRLNINSPVSPPREPNLPVRHAGGGNAAGAGFDVLVTKDAGDAGSDSAECTYTYTVKALDDSTTLRKNTAGDLATGMTPERPRYHYVEYWYAGETRTAPAVATSRYGLAAYDADGDLHLLVAYGEIDKDTAC